jgi:uncharacterized iron-regulated membrane protein
VVLPHSGDRAGARSGTDRAGDRAHAGGPAQSDSIVYAGERFGLHQLRLPKGDAGAYADQAGAIVTRWASQWERPELWLFDLHHHLFTGDVGETIIGVAGLCALLFTVTGAILWWRTRRTFKFRVSGRKSLSRPAIVMQHRDLGIVVAPLLLLSALTGTMMIFKPVAATSSRPSRARAEVRGDRGAEGQKRTDGRASRLARDHRRRACALPRRQIRILALPRKPGAPITIRMKRAGEWLPNGRSTLYFDAGDGHLLAANDALAMPLGAQVFNGAYPLHAAKVGGLAWRLVMTCSGLALALLGSLAVWTFWFKRPRARPRRRTRPD